MAVIYKTKCSICGGTLQYEEGQKTCLCEYCGALQSTADETKNCEVLLAEASIQLKKANFEKAAELYNEVLETAPSCSKAYFGKMLCYFKLESPDELIHGVWPPIHRISENAFWQFAIQYANDNERREYDDLLKAHETLIEKERRRRTAQEKAQEKLEREAYNKRIAEQRAAEESVSDLVEAAKVRGKLFQLQNSIDEIEKQINEHKAYMDYETAQIQKYLPILKQWTIHFQPNRKASIKRTVEAAQARRVDHEFKCVSLRDRVKWLRNDYDAIAPSLTPNCHSIGALEAIGLSLNGACFCIGSRDEKPIKWYAIARNANHVLFLVANMSVLTAEWYCGIREKNTSWSKSNLFRTTKYWENNYFSETEQNALQGSQTFASCGGHVFVLSKGEVEYYLLMTEKSKRFIPLPLCVPDEELTQIEKDSVYENYCTWWMRRLEADEGYHVMHYFNHGHWNEADNYSIFPETHYSTTAFIRPAMWLDVTKLDLSERVIIEPYD